MAVNIAFLNTSAAHLQDGCPLISMKLLNKHKYEKKVFDIIGPKERVQYCHFILYLCN